MSPQQAIIPAETDAALDAAMISHGPRATPVPLEYSGRYRLNNGPTTDMPAETNAQFVVRSAEQRALAREARGHETPKTAAPTERGQSLFDALQREPTAGRDSLPTIPLEYSRPSKTSRPTKQLATGLTMEVPDELPTTRAGKSGKRPKSGKK